LYSLDILVDIKERFTFVALCILALGSVQCSSPFLRLDPAKVELDSRADFKSYRTFAWNKPARTSPTPRPPWVEKEVQAEIERVLLQKGFVKAAADPPDLLVLYDIAVEEQMVHQPVTGGGGRFDVMVFTVRRGALLVSFLDSKTRRVVWSGLTGGDVEDRPQPETTIPRIRQAVDMILEKFPPR
jgi:hypothetical protein